MNNAGNRRLIEVTLPLKAISAQSAREKSIRHGRIRWAWKRERLRWTPAFSNAAAPAFRRNGGS